MKRLGYIILWMLTGLTLSAAYQYDNLLELHGNALKVKSNAKLTLSFVSTPWKPSTISGWDTLTILSTSPQGKTATRTVNIVGNSAEIGSFQTDDTLRFYLSNKQWSTMPSTFWGSGWDAGENTYEFLHFGGNYGNWGQYYTTQAFQVKGSPAGQPLPGLWSSLIFGGILVGVLLLQYRQYLRQAPKTRA